MRMLPAVVVLVLVVVGCRGADRGAERTSTAGAGRGSAMSSVTPRVIGAPVAAGSLRAPEVLDRYMVVVPEGASAAAAERAMLAVPVPGGVRTEVRIVGADALTSLPDFSRGMDDAQRAAIGRARQAVLGHAIGGPDHVADVLHTAAQLARAGGAAVHGWIVDLPTGKMYVLSAFDDARPPGFALYSEELASLQLMPEEDGGMHLATFGLARLGLPELHLAGIPRSFVDDALGMVTAASQTLIEQGGLAEDGVLALDVASLTTAPWPDEARAIRDHGGTGRVRFEVRWSRRKAPGPDAAPEIELRFPGTPAIEAMRAAMAAYHGVDRVKSYKVKLDDPRLVAARAHVQVELAALAPHFADGIPALERLLVRVSFPTKGGGEAWRLVEVMRWRGRKITGILIDPPSVGSTLVEGATVEVELGALVDYVHTRADGTVAGGEIDRILESMEGGGEP